jgi:excisionase family DNA binding protein
MTDPPIQWFTVADVARVTQVHPDTVKKWIRLGLLDTVKIGRSVRITQQAIDDLAYRRRQRAVENRGKARAS